MKLFIYGYLPSSIHHSYSENNNSTYLNIFTTIFVKSKQYLQADIIKFQKQSISDTLILFHKFNYYYLYHRIYRVPYSIIFLTIDHRIICYFFICFYFVVITCFICLCLCLGWDNLQLQYFKSHITLNMNNHQNNSTEQPTTQINKVQQQAPNQKSTVDYFLNIFYQKNRYNQNGAQQVFNTTKKNVEGFGSLNYHPNQSKRAINGSYSNSYQSSCHSSNGSNYCYVLVTILLASILIILAIDMRNQYDKELDRQKIRIGQCLKQYQQSQCDDPVDILIQRCKQLRDCYHSSPDAKISIVFAKVVAHIFNTFIQQLGLISLAVFLLIVLFFVWKPNWNYTHTYTPNHAYDPKYTIKNY